MTSVEPPGTTTRRLSAGAYLDADFRDRLLREVYVAWRRRIAPSYGYDLAQLLRHAWRAWWTDRAVDLAAAGLLLAGLLVAPLSAVLAVGLIGTVHSLGAALRSTTALVRLLRRTLSLDAVSGARLRLRVDLYGLAACLTVTVLALLAMRSDGRSWPLTGSPLGTVLLFLGFALAFGLGGAARQVQLDRLRHGGGAPRDPRSRRLRSVRVQQHHPFTVYSGFRPFVGSGRVVREWSFAQRLVHRQDVVAGIGKGEEFTNPPFRTAELVQAVKDSMTELASTTDAETRLPGLQVHDRVFIEGTHVGLYPQALEHPPSPDVVRAVMEAPSEIARHHVACQVEAWEGELVTTVFVHVSMQGRMLYVELAVCALTPTPLPFHVIDEIGGTGARAAAERAVREATRASRLLRAPAELVRAPLLLVGAVRAQRDQTAYRGRLDIGAAVSGREMAGDQGVEAGPQARDGVGREVTSWFQFRDVARHSKIIERRVLATIEAFLKARDVDTSDFTQRVNAILNNGIIHTGTGDINVEDSTFGDADRSTPE